MSVISVDSNQVIATIPVGNNPDGIAVTPDGAFVYVCNQESDNIVTFLVDQATGELSATGQRVETGSPVTIVFV